PLDHALELTHVAGPVMPLQGVQRVAGETHDVLAKLLGEAGAEMFGEQFDVGSPVPQRGHYQAERTDPVIEFRAEPSLLDDRRQIVAGGQDESRSGTPGRPVMAGGHIDVVELKFAEQLELDL